jgi:hypothetical protein
MKKEIIIYIIAGLFILGLLIITLFPGIIQAWRDSGKSADEKCKPAPGYTEQEWREHMSHHPDIYKECLT